MQKINQNKCASFLIKMLMHFMIIMNNYMILQDFFMCSNIYFIYPADQNIILEIFLGIRCFQELGEIKMLNVGSWRF